MEKESFTFSNDDVKTEGRAQPKQEQRSPKVIGGGISLGKRSALLMGGNRAESNVEALFKNIGEVMKTVEGVKTDVNIYSKNVFTNLEYSAVVISVEENKNKAFFTLLIEASGTNQVTPDAFLENVYQKRLAFVPTDAVNAKLIETITDDMRAKNPDVTFTNLDGIMIRSNADLKDESLAAALASEAFNTCVLFIKKEFGDLPDISLKEDIREANADLTVSETTYTESATDMLGNKKYVSWGLDLVLTARGKQNVVNSRGNSVDLASIKGHIQFVPTVTPVPVMGGGMSEKRGIYPIVVTNIVETEIPTLSYALIAISLSSLMADNHRWINPIIPNLKQGKDAGVFNKFVNVTNESKPKAYNLTDRSINRNEKANLIASMVMNQPVLALEIQAFGENTSSLSAFSVAATSGGSGSHNARKEIISTLVEMTGGEFPENFDTNKIFAGPGAVMPDGYFIDKKGEERSLSEIDLMFMLSLGGEKADHLTNRYIRNELGQSDNSFIDTLEIYKELDLNCIVTGRKTRVFFSAEFINTMARAFKECGLSPRVDTTSLITSEVGYGFSNSLLQAGGNQGNVGFGVEYAGASYSGFEGINIGQGHYHG